MIEGRRKIRFSFNLRSLRLSLKYRPEVLKLILKMRQCLRNKNAVLIQLKQQLKAMAIKPSTENHAIEDNLENSNKIDSEPNEDTLILVKDKDTTDFVNTETKNKEKTVKKKPKVKNKSTQTNIAVSSPKLESESAEPVVEPDETGWQLNEENDSKSIADQVKEVAQNAMQQSGMVYVESAGMYYDYKTGYYYNSELGLYYHTDTDCYYYYSDKKQTFVFHSFPDRKQSAAQASLAAHEKRKAKQQERARKAEEDIDNLTKNLSQVSLRGQIALESVASQHPPCMRVIVRETNLPKLRVGSLFIVTKDGGTIGRIGEQHAILIYDSNVSRNHMNIIYDSKRRSYFAVDLGSKNGSILNGSRMSESEVVSEPMEVVHGSTIQLGETKLLCHIHPGNNTCGHCEPGLLMEAIEKEKKAAYTRTCSVKKQHELELARLKNKYVKPQLAIEETAYNDRAQARREAVGSSHHAEKTQTSDISMPIAADNKGFKLLEKMGWNEGQGLGKDNQGYVSPVPLISNEGKTGLGATPEPHNPNTLGSATIRLAARTKMLKPPAKAFQGMLDEDSE